jgi:glucose-6-phosphate 1-epimerase
MSLSIPGLVEVARDANGLECVTVTNTFARAQICFHGGHVTAFEPQGQKPVLWLSPLSAFQPGKAIRGGIPICWPWFGPHPNRPDMPAHGFARTRSWKGVDAAQLADGRTRLRLSLEDDADTRALWPHAFSLILSVTIGEALELELTTVNTGDTPFSYTDALHTYVKVADVLQARVDGFEGAPFVHSTRHFRGVQSGPIAFQGEVNNIYVPNRSVAAVTDPGLGRVFEIEKSGSLATVVWNPGEVGGSGMKDVGPHWNEFLCVEAANCADTQVTLLPGTSHTTTQRIRVARAT